LIGIHRQEYYRAIKSKVLRKEQATIVVDLVQAVRIRLPRIGGKKLYYLLKKKLQELKIGRDKLFKILRANNLLIKAKRQYHITTNSFHRFKKHKNKIEELVINRPEQVVVSDITYLGTRTNPMYLALVTDAYSKKILGYNVSNSLNTKGALDALHMAINNRTYKKEVLIHHSDRGIQYCSDLYQETLNTNKIVCSMTEKYDPYQNAIAERINGIIKQEFIGDIEVGSIDLMRLLIDESIAIYNTERPHFSCNLMTPKKMHQQRELRRKTYKMKKQNTLNIEYSA
jgi:transposase InsO family protein